MTSKKGKKSKKDSSSKFHRTLPSRLHANQGKRGKKRTKKAYINDGKRKKIEQVYPEYKKALASTASYQWRLFFQGAFNFSNQRDWLPESLLSDRYLRDAEYQTVETLKSYLSNRKNEFRRYVASSTLDDKTKHKLHTINSWNAWYYRKQPGETLDPRIISYKEVLKKREQKNIEKKIKEGKKVYPKPIPPYLGYSENIFFLARRIMKATFRKNNKPSFNHPNMKLSANTAKIMPRLEDPLPKRHSIRSCKTGCRKCCAAKNPLPKGHPIVICKTGCQKCHSAKNFSYWVKFSTLKSGKPIYLPLEGYQYFFESLEDGRLCNHLQFNFDELGNLKDIAPVIEKTAFKHLTQKEQETRLYKALGSTQPLSGEISLDTGLCIPLATQNSLHGYSFYQRLLKYDKCIQSLTKELNKQKIPWNNSKRYRHLSQDLRGYIKNELRRIINRIVSIYRPSKIIIDKVNFQSSHLSKRMNRLLRNLGIGAIKEKLTSLSEVLGIEIVWVNPAYTSQQCLHCGYIDRNNRNGRKFHCRLCKYKLHSDVSGARCGGNRSSSFYSSSITPETKKEVVLDVLTRRFIEQFDILQTKEPDHWLLRLRSKASFLLQKNPQYKHFLEHSYFKKFLRGDFCSGYKKGSSKKNKLPKFV